MRRAFLLTAAIAAAVFSGQAQADVVLSDNFDRADGSLTGTTPTPGPGAAWLDHSGTTGDLLIAGGQAVVQHGSPSEDSHSFFGPIASGILVATFDVSVDDDTQIGVGGTDFEYFAHFMTEGSFNFRSRLSVVGGTAGGDYTFGLSTGSGDEEAIFGTDFSFNDVVSATLTYDFSSGLSSFSANGSTITSTTSLVETSLDSFALRQSDSSNNETVFVDNLVVTAIPEPGSALVLTGLVGLVGLRRRK